MNGIPGRTVTRLRPVTVDGQLYDADGDPVAGQPTRLDIDDVLVAPRTDDSEGTGESHQRARTGVVVGLQLLIPGTPDISHLDQFEVDGEAWDVEGEPAAWPPPWPGAPGGTVVNLRRGAG